MEWAIMLLNTSEQNLSRSLLQKITIERRTPADDVHPLSLIMMDVSSLTTFLSSIDNKQKKTTSTITKILNDNTRKTDIKTYIHKSKFALFLPNTLESSAYTLSDRICDEIKKVLNKNNFSPQKSDHILFQISTYLKTTQGKGELKVFSAQYKKTLI
jgi:GGDEF domain-containing protein